MYTYIMHMFFFKFQILSINMIGNYFDFNKKFYTKNIV